MLCTTLTRTDGTDCSRWAVGRDIPFRDSAYTDDVALEAVPDTVAV